MKLVRMTDERFDEVVDVLCDAVHDYAVMRYVIGDARDEYDPRLRKLIGYFTESRPCRQYPGLGSDDEDGNLVAAANINPPHSVAAPPSVERTFEEVCKLMRCCCPTPT